MTDKPYLIWFLTLIIFSTLSSATIYENGENNTTNKWRVYDKTVVYDKNSTQGLIKNIFDEQRQSNVIKLKEIKNSNSFLIGDIKGSKAWNNKSEFIFTWSMKMKEPYQIILFANTEKGIRYLYFSPDKNLNVLNDSQYIHVDLNTSSMNGKWINSSFDISSRIKSYEADNKLLSINGCIIRGSGLIDNVELISNHNDFISTMKINKEKKLRISTNDKFAYNFNINWGDGTTDSNVSKTITHHYDKEGIYKININGNFPHTYNLCSKEQTLLSIEQWGTQVWESMKESFKNCENFSNINTQTAPNLENVKSMYRTFYNAFLFNADISSWDVSNVTDMSAMFYHAENFNQNIGDWNLSSVKDTSFMFNYASVFNQDISQWDVSSVEDMQLMFRAALKFNQNISQWNVSSVKTSYNMFKGATSFNQNLDNWDTSSLRDNSNLTIKRNVIPEHTPVMSDTYYELEELDNLSVAP